MPTPMHGPYIPPREPARHGDTLNAREIPTIAEIIGTESAIKLANACRFIGIIAQSQGDRATRARHEKIAQEVLRGV